MSAHETLGLLLVREGLITRPQLYDALRVQRQTGRLLGTCLLSLGHVRPEALLAMLSRQLSIPALPPGTLNRASPGAVRRVPRDVAMRLGILPYSWDGQMLGVAVADGRVLAQLHEVAYHARAAVGAYVALETEIDAVLKAVYPEPAVAPPRAVTVEPLERPRPPRVLGAGDHPVSAQDLGPAVLTGGRLTPSAAPLPDPLPAMTVEAAALTAGLDLASLASSPSALNAGEADLSMAALPEAVQDVAHADVAHADVAHADVAHADVAHAIERVSFFDAVERLYEAGSPEDVGRMVGRALLNYFQRVLVIYGDGQRFRVIGCAGLTPRCVEVPESFLPLVAAKLGERQIAYGLAAIDARASELAAVFGFEPGASALIATVGTLPRPRLAVLADNDASTDLYEDLHDVELLLKEAETGLGMLLERAPV